MGIVLEVENVLIAKNFALKLIDMQVASPDAVRRFQRESKLLSQLDHPNIIRALDFGILDEGSPYVLMELLDGETLAEYLKNRGRVSVSNFNEIFVPILNALDFAHRTGIVHRDLKPGNIMLLAAQDGTLTPKLLDFGIAAWTERASEAFTKTGEIIGTPLYISPEQVNGQPITPRSDLYSLGCVMFEALTGAPPFTGRTALETLMMHKEQPVPKLNEASLGGNFPPYLEKTVNKLLSKNSDNRFSSAIEVAECLTAQSFKNESVETETPAAKRNANQTVLLLSAIVLFAGFGAGSYFLTRDTKSISTSKQNNTLGNHTNLSNEHAPNSPTGTDLTEKKDAPIDALVLSPQHLEQIIPTTNGSNVELHFDNTERSIGSIKWFVGEQKSSPTDRNISIPAGIKFWLEPNLANPLVADQIERFHKSGLYGVIMHVSKNAAFLMSDETMTKCLKLMPDSVEGIMFDESRIMLPDVKALKHLNKLEWLGVKDSQIEDEAVQYLAANAMTPSLRSLVLSPPDRSQLAKPFIEKLSKSKNNLQQLSVSRCGIDVEDCQNIVKIDSLRYLNVMNCFSKVQRPIAIKIISRLPNLEVIAIDGEDINDASATNLLAMKSLKKLMLGNTIKPEIQRRFENSHKIKMEFTDSPDVGFQPWRAAAVLRL